MSDFGLFGTLGSALSAQTVRLNTVASNLANADQAAGSPEQAYQARVPVFAAVLDAAQRNAPASGVQVKGIAISQEPPRAEYQPGHPLADPQGYVYYSNVRPVEQMADMISASRSYESAAQALSTVQDLIQRTLRLGDS
ncbi:flagellar basal body rod protein FlgC [Immundisolibacter sp.]|uniref:flagellar basal body rod protein FlgC n=1 Tax=Immundisolibacter sp. TaxID=1934948 RepID=UPI003564C61F